MLALLKNAKKHTEKRWVVLSAKENRRQVGFDVLGSLIDTLEAEGDYDFNVMQSQYGISDPAVVKDLEGLLPFLKQAQNSGKSIQWAITQKVATESQDVTKYALFFQ